MSAPFVSSPSGARMLLAGLTVRDRNEVRSHYVFMRQGMGLSVSDARRECVNLVRTFLG